MKAIIITGCAGLIGNHLTRFFLKKGYKVIGIDNLSGGYLDLLPMEENFIFYQFSLEDADLSKEVFLTIKKEYNPLAVYHLAAYASEGLSPFIRHYNYTNNILASVNVINACIKYGWKIIFTSSMAVYGDQTPPFTESMAPSPSDPYGIAKYAVEMDIKQAHDQFGLRYNIVRPHNVVGIYQNIWDIYRNVIGIFVKKTLNKEPMTIYGDGKQTRAFSDIKYILEPFYSLAENHDNDTFNIGADKYYSINNISDLFIEIAPKYGLEASKVHKEERHEVKHAFCDHTKAKEILNFQDETDIKLLIHEMLEWSMTQPDREVKYMNYEINNGMYSYWQLDDTTKKEISEDNYSEIKTEYIDTNRPSR